MGNGTAPSGCAERMVDAMADMKGSLGSSESCATRALSRAAWRLWRKYQKTNGESRTEIAHNNDDLESSFSL